MTRIMLTAVALGTLAGCAHDPYYGGRNYTRDAVVGGTLGAVTGVAVELVWDPPWTRERMSDEARLQLGML